VKPARTLAALLALGLVALVPAAPAAARQQDDDGVYVDEIKKEFLEKIAKYAAAKDWKAVFDNYAVALTKYRSKLVRPDPAVPVWCSVVEHLNREFAKLPADAFQYYRLENDGKARSDYLTAVAEDDRRLLEKLVEEYFFAEITGEALDYLGSRYFEERRPQEAIHFWRKLLETYPDPKIPREVIAARMAMAAVAWPNERALEDVRRIVAAKGIDGKIVAGGREVNLSEFLKGLSVPRPPLSAAIGKLPIIPDPENRFERKVIGVRNEVKRWTFDLSETAQQPRGGRIRRGFETPQVASRPEYPFFPAYGRVGTRELVMFTNGQRVIAMNPSRAAMDKPESCVYWQFPDKDKPPVKKAAPDSNFAGYIWYTMPQIGVTIDGNIALATMYSEKKVPEGGNQNQDIFQGTCRLVAFNLWTGGKQVRWDTDDEEIHSLFRKLEFYDRNWTFSGPPLVKGDRIYVGVSTSPIGESESRVLCLDRRTGKPLWTTFLGSVPNRSNPMWGGGGRFITYVTSLAEEGGVIFAHGNIGCVAAIHSVTGNILWLSKYPRAAGQRDDNWGRGVIAPEIRPPNPLFLHRGRLYTLPQDCWEWQVFDVASGKRLDVPAPKKSDGEIQWRATHQIVGVVEDWMVLGGTESHVVNLVDRKNDAGEVRMPAGRAYSLPRSNVSKCGRGVVAGETIYLPTCDDVTGALAIYHGVGSFKNLDQPKWKEANEYGNLVVAGDYLVVCTQTKAMVYTDEGTIDREFVRRLVQSPPNPGAFLEHGDIMRKNDRLVRAAEGDPKWDPKVREVKTELHDIFMRRGDEASGSSDVRQMQTAAEYFAMAQGFAYDERTMADATRRLGETYERLATAKKSTPEGKEFAKKAVEEYQRIIEKSRDSYHKPEGGDLIQKMYAYAQNRIRDLRKAWGDDVVAPIEDAAREALKGAKEGSSEALRKITELYPDTKAARDAWDRMLQELEKQGDFKKLLSTLREMRDKFPERRLELQKRLNETLEKLFDWKRLSIELTRTATLFGDEKIVVGEQEMTMREWVSKKLETLRSMNPEMAVSNEPVKAVGEMDALKGPGGRWNLTTGLVPLHPIGLAPAGIDGDHEFFARGSSIELWNVKENRKVWSAPHPGGWLGAGYQDVKAGAELGASIIEILAGSPAEKAGLQAGDVIVQMDARAVRVESFDEQLAAAGAGATVRLHYRRGTALKEVEVALAAWPSDSRPGIVGVVFTRDYQVAVVWEDGIMAFDAATGAPGWTFRAIRDRFTLVRAGAVDGRVFVHEHFRVDRPRGPYRALSSQMQQEKAFPAEEDSHSRVICLDDATGEVRWAKSFPFDAGAAPNHAVEFHAEYLGDTLAVYNRAFRGNVQSFELQILDLEGQLKRRTPLGNNVIASAVEPERGIFYYVEGSNMRILRGLRLWGADAEKGAYAMEIQLQPKYMDGNAYVCGLEARGDWVALVVPPWNQGAVRQPRGQPAVQGTDPKVVIFSLKTGKEHALVPLPEGRSLPMNCAVSALGPGDMLYVYNVPGTKVNPPAGERRAYLTAWRIVEGDARFELAWDAVAPWLTPQAGTRDVVAIAGSVILYAQQASMPRDASTRAMAAVYDRERGYLQTVVPELAVTQDALGGTIAPLDRRNGRVYLQTTKALQVWGN